MPRAALLILLLLTSCNEEPAQPTTPSPTPQATTEPTEEASPPAEAECTDETITGNTEVTIRQNDNVFSPNCLVVLGGQGLKIVNAGAIRHNFSIEGTDVDLDNEAGETIRTEALAGIVEPGTHKFVCKYHASQGMRGEITLTEAG